MTAYSGRVLLARPHFQTSHSIKARCPDRLMECFESLGDGCEFGNVQRFCGIEPLGLLRFASLPYRALITMLDTRFSELPSDPASLRLHPHGQDKEWWVGMEKCGIYYHTGQGIGQTDESTLKRNEVTKIQFLKRKMLEELDTPGVIFVRRDPDRSLEEIRHAHRCLNEYGQQSLLWISRAPHSDMVGDIEVLDTGLVRGFINDTARDAAPQPPALADWLTLAEKTLRVLKPSVAEWLSGTAQPPSIRPADPVFRQSVTAATFTSTDVPPLPFHHHVAKHTLLTDTSCEMCEVLSFGITGLVSEALYTISAWVWLPPGFEGTACLVFPGTRAVKDWPADPSRAGCWQRIATSMRLPDGWDRHSPSLCITGSKGTHLYSTAWRFDRGACPSDCFRDP